MEPYKKYLIVCLKILLVFSVFFTGLFLRLDDVRVWQQKQKSYYLNGKPLFTSYDAYTFARYARLEQEGHYQPGAVDPLRFVPDNQLQQKVLFPDPIPQLSLLAAKTSSFLGISLETWSFYAIPVLACLFVFPLFIFLERLNYPAAGYLGAFVGVISLIYLVRTAVARLDTDALNLFYPFTISLLLLGYFRLKRPFNFLAVFAAAGLGNLFYWWYSPCTSILFAFMLCFLGAIFFERRLRPNRWDFLALLLFILPQIWFCWRAPFIAISYIKSLVYGKSSEAIFSAYPNILISISELNKIQGLKTVSNFVLPQYQLFLIGLLGFLVFVWKERRQGLLLLPLFPVGLLVFKAGNRFGMYLAPYVGIGLGFWIHFLWDKIVQKVPSLREEPFLKTLVPLLIVVILGAYLWFISKSSRSYVANPKVLAPIAADLQKLTQFTPDQAWIWTWWDFGYPIAYFSNRGVFIDGGSQSTPKTYYVALSFTIPSPQEAYNIISFIGEKGLTGIEEKLREGIPADRLTELIRKGAYGNSLKHPVYWLFTGDLFTKFAWISYFGSWDFQKKSGRHGFILLPKACRQKGKLVTCANAKIDFKKGEALVRKDNKLLKIKIKKLILLHPDGFKELSFHPQGVIAESVYSSYGSILFLVDEKVYQSNFNQMFILRQYDPRYFRLVFDDFPYAVLYEVRQKKD